MMAINGLHPKKVNNNLTINKLKYMSLKEKYKPLTDAAQPPVLRT